MIKEKGFSLKEIIIIIVLTSLITSITTGVIVYNQNKLTKNLTYKDLSKDVALKEFLNVYASLIDEYYEDVDKTKMLETAINAMFNYLGEDYSTYMSKNESDSLAEKLLGEYKGIGVSLNMNNEIVNFLEGGIAEKSGLQIGDRIIGINDIDASNMTTSELSDIITNIKEDEKIKISVKRGEETLNFEVENKKIIVPAITNKMLENNIGYLQISTFSNTLKKQVENALKDLEHNNMKSLIIDLRNNTGGYLSAAKYVANMFLEKGKIIYSLEEKEGIKNFKDTTEEKRDYKIIILQNESSASASEVLISALKDNGKAKIVGTVSYGKGKVQQTHTLEDGSMIKYTSAKWLRPNGECIDNKGITPDYPIADNPETEDDEQLLKALEVINEG